MTQSSLPFTQGVKVRLTSQWACFATLEDWRCMLSQPARRAAATETQVFGLLVGPLISQSARMDRIRCFVSDTAPRKKFLSDDRGWGEGRASVRSHTATSTTQTGVFVPPGWDTKKRIDGGIIYYAGDTSAAFPDHNQKIQDWASTNPLRRCAGRND